MTYRDIATYTEQITKLLNGLPGTTAVERDKIVDEINEILELIDEAFVDSTNTLEEIAKLATEASY